ncbi:DNA cytosine methyltransferase [Acidocella sp.]|uniref:DNA cytosine methyltransferase n=1 Tax=Acidocella sp. TaxID=50710 RepID=UPI00262925A3|nr:DNA cytosine methyltransferase [Acidocella sp.]
MIRPDELIVDLFAGGGGASQGIYQATGRHPDIAVNHDPDAIAVHLRNHPETEHHCESVWKIEPVAACAGRPVGLLWASPDCRHFSRAAGGRPKWKAVRSLPGVVLTWATRVRPRKIVVENVREMLGWGPLLEDGTPCRARVGRSFNQWAGRLRGLGYRVEWRELCGADFGAPTIRTRLVIVASLDGSIVWPQATHARLPSMFERPWRAAAECIDWSLPCRSIFDRPRPLKDATLRRIAEGIMRYVVNADTPYIVLAVITGCGGRTGQSPPRAASSPVGTITTKADQILVTAHTAELRGTGIARGLNAPLSTITTAGTQQQIVEADLSPDDLAGAERVAAFLVSYYGQGGRNQSLERPLGAITTRDRFALVLVDGVARPITDIRMRMLAPHELARAQGFPATYDLTDGGRLSKTAEVRLIGNSVCPDMAEAVIRSIFHYHTTEERMVA